MNKEQDRLENFLNGFTAAAQLLARAGEQGFFIEYICLSASLIDALLRIGLILQHQLETKTKSILNSLLFQEDERKIITERKIYKMSLRKGIISKDLFNQLENLYKKRNRVIHRYIISDIKTKEVFNIGVEYEQIKRLVSKAVENLENQQIKLGIGMTVLRKNALQGEMQDLLDKMSADKHGDIILNYGLKRKNNL